MLKKPLLLNNKNQNFVRKFNAQKLAITFIPVSGRSKLVILLPRYINLSFSFQDVAICRLRKWGAFLR